MSTYILVDFSNLIHRCKHVSSSDIETKSGMALHIILNSLRQAWRRFNADHIVICLEGKSWRTQIHSGYKANRQEIREARTKSEIEDDQFYFDVMNELAEFLTKWTNVSVLRCPIAEADDLIAQWVKLHPDDQNVIVSGDTDFFQLLSEKVIMYDGVKGWLYSTTSVIDENNKPAKTKKTLKEKDKKGRLISKTVEIDVKPPNPEYELFKKIIRGDSTDNIMGAYPGVREDGTVKRPGILQAFNDRKKRGYEWNQFMLTEWNKLVGVDSDGQAIMKQVRVSDEYKVNQQLIDLDKQPDAIKQELTTTIITAVSKEPHSQVGVRFLQFSDRMKLNTISNNPNDYAKMLAAPYSIKT